MEDALKAWENKAKANTSSNSNMSLAISLRERGNDKFKSKQFELAKILYSQSLQACETVESLTNRALCEIKLNQFLEAIEDSSRALVIDHQSNLKALIRRGAALSALGRHDEALADFLAAKLIDPQNRAIQLDCEREQAFIQANRALEVDDDMEVEEEEEEPSPISVPRNQLAEETLLNFKVDLPQTLPKTELNFYRVWRDLTQNQQLEMLTKMDDFASCFSSSIEPDLFEHILRVAFQNDQVLHKVIRAFSKLPSFSLAKMMLDRRLKSEIQMRSDELKELLN